MIGRRLRCARIRAAMDRCRDGGAPLSARARSHIRACPACRSYEAYLHALSEDLRDVVDAGLRNIPMPDLQRMRLSAQQPQARSLRFRRPPAWPRPRLWAAAAMAVLVLGSAALIYPRVQLRRSVRLGASLLVDSVLADSLLKDVEYAAASLGESQSLLDDLGGSRRLFGRPSGGGSGFLN